jgi:hypothetical protein
MSTLKLDTKTDDFLLPHFFTIQNIKSLFEKNKRTGECSDGLYFFCYDMILVEEVTVENIVKTIEELSKEGVLESAFKIAN